MINNLKKEIKVGNLVIGGNNNIIIQSMTNTKTKDIEATVKQINALKDSGAQIVRLAILNIEDALSIREIKEKTDIPLVADIHFDYKLALAVIDQGIDKLRLNPANIKDTEKVKEIAKRAKEKNIPIRIGINSGSFKTHDNVEEMMIDYAKKNIELLENEQFYDIVLSFKSSNLETTIKVNQIADKLWNYPLHLGMTEAGSYFSGSIKNSIGIGILLNQGIGSTIRVSLTSDPVEEIPVAKEILHVFGLYQKPTLISCPTCGRLEYDMFTVVEKIEKYLNTIDLNIKVAIMGCVVNGPGEAKQADIGIAGGKDSVILFKKGVVVKTLKTSEAVPAIIDEIEKMRINSK